MIVSKFIKAYSAVFVKKNPENEKEGAFQDFLGLSDAASRGLFGRMCGLPVRMQQFMPPNQGTPKCRPCFFLSDGSPLPQALFHHPWGQRSIPADLFHRPAIGAAVGEGLPVEQEKPCEEVRFPLVAGSDKIGALFQEERVVSGVQQRVTQFMRADGSGRIVRC